MNLAQYHPLNNILTVRRTFILRISVDWQIHGHDAGLLTVSVLKKSVHTATAHNMKVSIQSSNNLH